MIAELYQSCPRYHKCSVNCCPLDSFYPERGSISDNPQLKCTIAKSIRLRVHNENGGNLKFKGMTVKEYQGWKRWNDKPKQEKQQYRDRLQIARKSLSNR